MSQASEELFTIQEQMEAEMTGQGLTRYWRNVDRSVAEGDESSTSYGLTVLKRVINPVAARIEEAVAEADSGKPGRRSTAIKYLRGTSADLIAYLTVKVLLDSVSRQRTLQSIAIAIGQRLEDEARFRKFNDENPALFQVVSRDLQSRTSNLKQKRRVLIHTMRQKSAADWDGWSKVNKLHLGQRLIDIVMSTVGLVSILHTSKGRGKSVIYVQPTAELVDLISERNGQCELLDPVFVPMVVPPKSWSTPHDGGYWFSDGGAPVSAASVALSASLMPTNRTISD